MSSRTATWSTSGIRDSTQYRVNNREFRHFLRHARGSPAELETQLLVAQRVGYLPEPAGDKLLKQIAEVGRILSGLIASIPED